jgi:DNA-binding beta-propeller fold protein YncE
MPTDLALDTDGNLFIAEPGSHRIRRVDPSGAISTFAGTGRQGSSGDGGPATEADLNSPFGVAVDSLGNVYVVDTDNHRVRRVERRTGIITTVVGSGDRGFGGDGGLATDALLARPHRVVVTRDGDLYVGDSFNHRIRRVHVETGRITTIAGTGRMGDGGDGGSAVSDAMTYTGGLLLDGAGGLFFTDLGAHRVRRIDLESGLVTAMAGTGRWAFGGDGGHPDSADFHLPASIALTPDGDLVLADMWNGRIRRIGATERSVTTLAGSRESRPAPEIDFHFHFDAEAIRGALDQPVAAAPPPAGSVRSTRLSGEEGAAESPAVELFRASRGTEPLPLVVLLHGRTNYEWSPLTWGGLRSWATFLAGNGFSVALVEHRLGSMPESLDPADHDVAGVLEQIRAGADEFDIDPDRVCLLSVGGGSALVAPYLAEPPSWLRCAAMFSPHAALEPPAIWDWALEAPEARERHTLTGRVTASTPPLFLAIGLEDRSALTGPFETLVEEAAQVGIQVEVARHSSGGAEFERLAPGAESRAILSRLVEFLLRYSNVAP